MRVATIFYGFFRTFEYCKDGLRRHLLDAAGSDLFFYSPETIYAPKDHETPNLHHAYSRNERRVDDEILNFLAPNLKAYELAAYNSRPFIEMLEQNNLPLYNDFTRQSTWRMMSYIYNLKQSIKVFREYCERTGNKYDVVLITRPDLRYYCDFNFSVINKDKINHVGYFLLWPNEPHMKQHFPPGEERFNWKNRRWEGAAPVHGFNRKFNDNIYCGTQENILKYENLFDVAIEYAKEGICFNQETFIGAHCLKNGMDFCGADIVSYEIWRPDRQDWLYEECL